MPKISVLIVEDNPVAAKGAEGLLLEKKCLVDIAENGLRAVEKFETGISTGFYGYWFARITGFEVTERIRRFEESHYHSAIIIGLTASATEETLILGLKSGMNAVWAKPLIPEMLNKVLVKLDAARENAVKKPKKAKIKKSKIVPKNR